MSRTPVSRFSQFIPIFRPWPLWLRWSLLAALLAGEVLFLSISFDTGVFAKGEDWWTRIANDSPILLRIGFAALAAFLLIVYPRLPEILDVARRNARDHSWLPGLVLHGFFFAGFFRLTQAIFQAAAAQRYPSAGFLAVWVSSGCLLLLSWLLAAAPFRYWRWLASREWVALVVAGSVGLAAWGLGELLVLGLWRFIAAGTFWLSKGLLGLLYDDVLYDRVDQVLGTPHFLVTISPQCSGYEGIGLITAFLTLYLWIFRSRIRFPHALLLFPLGAFAIWLANALRIALLIAIGTSYSKEVALGGFHSQAGWIAFALIALGLILLTDHFGLFAGASREAEPEAAVESHPTAEALLVPLLVLMGAVMLTSALSHGFDWLYPLRPIVAAAALWRYRLVYRGWDWSWSWAAVAIGVAVFAMWLLLEQNSDDSVLSNALAALPPGQRSGWLIFRVIGSVILVPVVEELAFRGYLLRRLVAANFEDVPPGRFTWLSFAGSSIAFGLVHGRWLAGTLAGMAFAGAVYRRGKLADAVVAHMTTNGLIALWVLIFREWRLWS